MAKQLILQANTLLNGSNGSIEQRKAHEWLLEFQVSYEAWAVCCQVLHFTVENPQECHPIAIFVSAQILKNKVFKEWDTCSMEDKANVKKEILYFLSNIQEGTPKSLYRPVCANLASIIIQSLSLNDWSGWKEEIFLLPNPLAILETLAVIPLELERRVNFQRDHFVRIIYHFHEFRSHVITFVSSFLQQNDIQKSVAALECLSNWLRSSLQCDEHQSFGISLLELESFGVLDCLLTCLRTYNEEIYQITVDILVNAASFGDSPCFSSQREYALQHSKAIFRMIQFLLSLRPVVLAAAEFIRKEKDENSEAFHVAHGLARLSFVIAENHLHLLFADDWCIEIRNLLGIQSKDLHDFMCFLVDFTGIPSKSIVQESLEFWHFLLDSGEHWEIDHTLRTCLNVVQDTFLVMLERVIILLVGHCELPIWYIEGNMSKTEDFQVLETKSFRKEIADTLLSISSKSSSWVPAFCLANVLHQLQNAQNSATLEATLFCLEYLAENLDDEEMWNGPSSSSSSSTKVNQLWIDIVDMLHQLPKHLHIVLASIRLITALSSWLWLYPSQCHQAYALVLNGLHFSTTIYLSSHSLKKLGYTCVQNKAVEFGSPIGLLLSAYEDQRVQELLWKNAEAYCCFCEAIGLLIRSLPSQDCIGVIQQLLSPIIANLQLQLGNPSSCTKELIPLLSIISCTCKGLGNSQEEAALQLFEALQSIMNNLIVLSSQDMMLVDGMSTLFKNFISSLNSSATVQLAFVGKTCFLWAIKYRCESTYNCISSFLSNCKENSELLKEYHPMLMAITYSFYQEYSLELTKDIHLMIRKLEETCCLSEGGNLLSSGHLYFKLMENAVHFCPMSLCITQREELVPLLFQSVALATAFLSVNHKQPELLSSVIKMLSAILRMPIEFNSCVVDSISSLVTTLTSSVVRLCLLQQFPTTLHNSFTSFLFICMQDANTTKNIRDQFLGLGLPIAVKNLQLPATEEQGHLIISRIQNLCHLREFRQFFSRLSLFCNGLAPIKVLNLKMQKVENL